MAFGPNGWDPSPNLKTKIARIYRLKSDPFLKDSVIFYEPEDDRLNPGVIEVDHVFLQGSEEVLMHVKNFTVSGVGPKKVMCSAEITSFEKLTVQDVRTYSTVRCVADRSTWIAFNVSVRS